ncbi:hypothetical protein O9K51_05773 [Purpureocillium lavendulum]|uniref:Transposase n=1 Tax=Purpureocillium lavendulum TaxID=1247861 RepID=A0AB34FTG0_9HYPO|nr:hypothetical protein O9K51_05773 [Purpureocillium lavendulum]
MPHPQSIATLNPMDVRWDIKQSKKVTYTFPIFGTIDSRAQLDLKMKALQTMTAFCQGKLVDWCVIDIDFRHRSADCLTMTVYSYGVKDWPRSIAGIPDGVTVDVETFYGGVRHAQRASDLEGHRYSYVKSSKPNPT